MKVRLQWLALALGCLLFLWVFQHVGFEETFGQIREVGWVFPLLLLPSVLTWVLFCLGWWWTLSSGVSFPSLFFARAAGEALNAIIPLAYLGGEPVKAVLLRRLGIPLADGLASVVVTKTVGVFTYCLFIFMGVAAALLQGKNLSAPLVGGVGAGLFLAASLFILYSSQRRGLFSMLYGLIYRFGGEGWIKKREAAEILDRKIVALYATTRTMAGCLIFSFLGWLATVAETYVFLWGLGVRVDLVTAVVIQALALGVKAVTFFVPGSLGTQEGGNVLIFLGLGLSGQAALAFSLLLRGRQAVWILMGLAVFTRFRWRELQMSPQTDLES
ncbi:MAG: flippase-like domain-containing protein [candidate division NC10 bacterium]|nr:flippase-like domain-containing protein [candidate division NC10 bacterium]